MPASPSWAFTRCHHHSNWGSSHSIAAHYSLIDPKRMKGWVGLVGWPIADGLPTSTVTHQLQVEHRTAKARRPKTDVVPLNHATNVDVDADADVEGVWFPPNFVDAADAKMAEGASICVLRIPSPPFFTGNESWSHRSSFKSTLRTLDRPVWSLLSNSSSNWLPLQSAYLSRYSTAKLFFGKDKASWGRSSERRCTALFTIIILYYAIRQPSTTKNIQTFTMLHRPKVSQHKHKNIKTHKVANRLHTKKSQ